MKEKPKKIIFIILIILIVGFIGFIISMFVIGYPADSVEESKEIEKMRQNAVQKKQEFDDLHRKNNEYINKILGE